MHSPLCRTWCRPAEWTLPVSRASASSEHNTTTQRDARGREGPRTDDPPRRERYTDASVSFTIREERDDNEDWWGATLVAASHALWPPSPPATFCLPHRHSQKSRRCFLHQHSSSTSRYSCADKLDYHRRHHHHHRCHHHHHTLPQPREPDHRGRCSPSFGNQARLPWTWFGVRARTSLGGTWRRPKHNTTKFNKRNTIQHHHPTTQHDPIPPSNNTTPSVTTPSNNAHNTAAC